MDWELKDARPAAAPNVTSRLSPPGPAAHGPTSTKPCSLPGSVVGAMVDPSWGPGVTLGVSAIRDGIWGECVGFLGQEMNSGGECSSLQGK